MTRFLTRLLAPAAVLAAGLLLAPALVAQTQPTADPNRLQQRFQPPVTPRVQDQPLIPRLDQPLPPEQAAKITFTLQDLVIGGVTVYEAAALRRLYADKLGTQSSLAVVYQIADAIAALYRNDGYVLVQVFPPAQRVKDGIVRLQVVEGFIHKIELEGDPGPHRERLEAYIARIQASRPLDNNVLERFLLLANDLPGLTAKALLLPSFEQAGASDMVLQLKYQRWGMAAQLDNRGTRFIGPFQIQTHAWLNGVHADEGRLEGRFITSHHPKELRYLDVAYSRQVGTDGTQVGTRGVTSRSIPGFTLGQLDVDGESDSIEIWASHDFIRSRRRNLALRGGFVIRDTQTHSAGALVSRDSLRVLTLDLSADRADDWFGGGVNLGGVGIAQGLDIIGAQGTSRPGGNTDFTKLTANIGRFQSVGEDFRLHLAAKGQVALNEVFASEEFGFGGADFGRAFDPSEITGDHGIASKLELQYAGFELPFLDSSNFYAFVDHGMVWREDRLRRVDRVAAASAGVGLRFRFAKSFTGYVEASKPIWHEVGALGNDGEDVRFFFSIGAAF